MPITRSAKKALRQSAVRRQRNLQKKEAYKNVLKNIKRAVAAGKPDDARKLLPHLYKTLDKAAKTNAIKKNRASRLKSRISKFIAGSSKK